jgi:hypothetical protein
MTVSRLNHIAQFTQVRLERSVEDGVPDTNPEAAEQRLIHAQTEPGFNLEPRSNQTFDLGLL